MFTADRVLVLAPHTDDGEFGCGGTVACMAEKGSRIIYVAFSAAEQSVSDDFPRDILRKEVKLATQKLGVASLDCVVLQYEVRLFADKRQAILDDMIRLNKEYKPDLVLLPSAHDTHQDHAVIASEGFRSFKRTTMLGYEVPWNNLDFRTGGFMRLEERHLKLKVEALRCYESQAHRSYATEEFVRSLAITRGVQSGTRYAEAFEVVRWIMS